MQSHRRLKLALVLLLAVGLIGGVAFWFYRPWLNAEERRLVGRWKFESHELELTADGYFEFSNIDNLKGFEMRWKAKDDRFSMSFVKKSKIPVSLDSVLGFLERIPFVGRMKPRRWKDEKCYQMRWKNEDTVVLKEDRVSTLFGSSELTMRRIAASDK